MKRINFGIIGLGRIGIIHLSNISNRIPEAQVIAVADANEQNISGNLTAQQVKYKFTDFHQLLATTEVDAVVIATPTNTHAEIILAAAQAKKAIFCERPIDLSIEKTKIALKSVRDNNVKLMIGFNRRFNPNCYKIYSMINAQKIGRIHLVKTTSRETSIPSKKYLESSGGIFLDMSIQDLDMCRFMMGREVESVFALADRLWDPSLASISDYDTALVTLTFEGGGFAVIDNSRKSDYGFDHRMEIFGDKGMLEMQNELVETHRYHNREGVQGSGPVDFFNERYILSYARELRDFCSSILSPNRPISVGGTDALIALEMAIAAKISCHEKRQVHMSEFRLKH
ncbi:MAG: inositol 2-dehydrogenase [Oligoflexia bacterium]|nr:inositol 2-dehydrogenase [Oligoflexia bacterium]